MIQSTLRPVLYSFILVAVGSATPLRPLRSGSKLSREEICPDRKQVVLSGLLPPKRVLLVPANYWCAAQGGNPKAPATSGALLNRRLPK